MREFVDQHRARHRSLEPLRAFSADEYLRRLSETRRRMRERGIDALVASAPDSMCWLHGMQSRWYRASSPRNWPPHACTIVHVDRDELVHFDYSGERDLLRETSVVSDIRYFDSDSWAPAAGAESHDLPFLIDQLRGDGLLGGTVALEMRSPIPHRIVSEKVQEAFENAGCRVIDGTDIIRHARRLKSGEEIATIERAAAIADTGLTALREAMKPGMTELELWGILIRAMSAEGGEPAALHELVAIGSLDNGHRMSSRRVVDDGDFVITDPCGVVDRYHANVSRTFFLGTAPRAARELCRIAGDAIDHLCEIAVVGTEWRDVNARMRDFYRRHDIWELRSWIGGYELGLSMSPDWVGEFTFSIEDEAPEGVVEHGLVTNFESNFHFPVLDTIVYETTGARGLSAIPRTLIEVR